MDVPTFEEAGFKGLVLDQWIGAFAPTGTQKMTMARLNVEINKVLTSPAVRESLEHQALEPIGTSMDEATRLFRDDVVKYARLMTELDISAK
jgi:tripartite-type tricarboxylate transporter receptor subunit TctC